MELDSDVVEQLQNAVESKSPVFLSTPALNMTFQTRILEHDENTLVVMNAVAPEFIHEFSAANEFFLQIGSLKFHCKTIESNGEQMIFPIMKSSLSKDIRQEKRHTFASETSAFCEILNPFDLKTVLRRPVIDLSASGISIRNLFESKLFQTKVELPEIKVFVDDRLESCHKGEVVYSRILMSDKKETSVQVGIKFLEDQASK